MKMISPWINYYREVEALFAQDPEVKVVMDEEKNHLRIFVDNARKAEALTKLLPEKKVFGNVELQIDVIPANRGENAIGDLISDAFDGNPVLESIVDIDTIFGKRYYAIFKNEVVQYFNDDMQDINGLRSTLYQELAKDVFETGDKAIFYCTEPRLRELKKPLGEWP